MCEKERSWEKLVLVNSGIGNLRDLSESVRDCLHKGRYFAVEDTRKFKDLLRRLGIPLGQKVIQSFHDHSGEQRGDALLAMASGGEDLYVASDRGSPVLSDPAYPLIRQALDCGWEVSTVSGVNSVLYALEISGLPPPPLFLLGLSSQGVRGSSSIGQKVGQGDSRFF